MDSISCYGHFCEVSDKCRSCEYSESCRFFAAGEQKFSRRSGHISFDKASNVIASEPYQDNSPEGRMRFALGKFFRYLLELDDYTMAIICEIITHNGTTPLSVRKLGEVFGCSRQAMHRKILSVIGKNPELIEFFRVLILKLNRCRKRVSGSDRIPAA